MRMPDEPRAGETGTADPQRRAGHDGAEEKYQALFNTIDQGFVIVEAVPGPAGPTADFRYLEANAAFSSKSGLGDVAGRLLSDVVPQAESLWLDQLRHVLSTGEAIRFEAYNTDTQRWYQASYTRIGGAGSTRVGVVFDDISDRKTAELALRESEARLAAMLESVPLGLAAIDTAGRVVLSNAHHRRFLPAGVIPSQDPDAIGRWRAWDAQGHPVRPTDFPGARAMRGESVVPGLEMLFAEAPGQDVWTRVATVPTRDDDGALTGAVSVISDIDSAKRAIEALRESEMRLREFGENSPDTLWIVDPDANRLLYLSAAYERMWGEPRARVMADLARWREHVHPDDRALVASGFPRLLAGERHSIEYRIIRPDGEQRWIFDTGFPIKDEQGRVTRIAGVAQDLTARREAEDRVTESERRFRTLSEGVPQLVWRAVDYGTWSWTSPQWTTFTGQPGHDSHGWRWLDMVHPDDRETARAAWARARLTGAFEVDYRLRHVRDRRYRWFTSRATPVRDDQGQLVEWLGTSTDIDDLRRLQGHQQLLVGELQHRVRNSLAVIRSIARRTAVTSDTVEDFGMHLDGRLASFARTQAAVTRDPAGGVDLGTIVVDELLAHVAREGEQAHVDGPEVRLQPKPGETLALAFHELTTNAVKYGALSVAGGNIRVSWRVEADHTGQTWLAISWDESRPGDRLAPPRRRGFGTELLEDTLSYDLEAETLLLFRPTGLLCTISIPFSDSVGRLT